MTALPVGHVGSQVSPERPGDRQEEGQGLEGSQRPAGILGTRSRQQSLPTGGLRGGPLAPNLYPPDLGGLQAEGRYRGQPRPCPQTAGDTGAGQAPGPGEDVFSGPSSGPFLTQQRDRSLPFPQGDSFPPPVRPSGSCPRGVKSTFQKDRK